MDETLEQDDDEQEKDDEDDSKNNDDVFMNTESDTNISESDTNSAESDTKAADSDTSTAGPDKSSAEDDASMTDDDPSKPIIKVDEPEAKKLKGDESLEVDDGMKSEEVASFTNNLEQNRNDLENDASSDVTTTSALNDEEKIAPLEKSKSYIKCSK
jgi:hypothetical protein